MSCHRSHLDRIAIVSYIVSLIASVSPNLRRFLLLPMIMKNFACAFALIWSYHVVRADEPPPPAAAAEAPVDEQLADEQLAELKLWREKLDELRLLEHELDRLERATQSTAPILFEIKIAEVSRKKLAERKIGSSLIELLTSDGEKGSSARGVLSESGQKMFDKLRADGVLKIVSEPSITTVGERPASMHVGGEVAVPMSGGRDFEFSLDSPLAEVQLASQNRASRVRYLRYGTSIDLVPVVLDDQTLRLELRLQFSHLDFANSMKIDGQKYPGLVSRRVDFATEAKFGKTIVVVLPPEIKPVASEKEAAADTDSQGDTDAAAETVVLLTPRSGDAMTPIRPVKHIYGSPAPAVPGAEPPPAPAPFQLPRYRVPQ